MGDDGQLDPAAAFGVLGNETRIAILEALAAATADGEAGLSFSALRERVGVRDAGQFNYHLSELRDRFVVKRDDGYHPRSAALRAVGAIRAGTYTDAPGPLSTETRFDCPDCGASLSATYDDGRVRLECPTHGEVFRKGVPPRAAADRSVETLVELADLDSQHDVERAVEGTCFVCWGRVESTVPVDSDAVADDRVYAELDCEDCWHSITIPVGSAVVRHPAVVSFYHDHGVDVRERPYLALDFVRDPGKTTVASRDPVRFASRPNSTPRR